MTPEEDRDLLLRALVWQAMDVKGWAPQYLSEACAAIVDGWERHPLNIRLALEVRRTDLQIEHALHLLQVTDPDRLHLL